MMEKFLDGDTEFSTDEIVRALRKGTLAHKFVPVLCGSAFKNKGVQLLLDAVVNFLPSPLDIPPVEGEDPDDDEKKLDAQGRPHGAVRGARVQDHQRPVRRQPDLLPRLLGHARERHRGAQHHPGQARAHRPHPADARQQARRDQDRRGGQHLRGRRSAHRHHGRHALRREARRSSSRGWSSRSRSSRSRSSRRPRTTRQARRVAAEARRRRPVVPHLHRRGDGADHHRRHGRAPPRDHRRPPAARVQGRVQRRQARGRVPRGHQQEGQGRGQVRQAVRRPRPVRPRLARDRARRARRGLRLRERHRRRRHPEGVHPLDREGRPRGAWAAACSPAIPIIDVKVALFDGSYHDVDSSGPAFEVAASMAFQDGAKRAGIAPARAGHGGRGRRAQKPTWATSSAT